MIFHVSPFHFESYKKKTGLHLWEQDILFSGIVEVRVKLWFDNTKFRNKEIVYFECKSRQCELQEEVLEYINHILKSKQHVMGERNEPIMYFCYA